MAAPVLLPAGLIRFGAERFFFAVADGLDPAGIYARRSECHLYRARPAVAESQVVLSGSAFVAVPFNREGNVRVGIQELRVCSNGALLIGANRFAVIVEVNVLDARSEQIRFRRAGTDRGGGGAALTVTRAVASCVPPAPFATRW